MLDDRELQMTLVMAEANMGDGHGETAKDDGLEHEPDGRVLQDTADLGGKVVHITPLGWDGHTIRVEYPLAFKEIIFHGLGTSFID